MTIAEPTGQPIPQLPPVESEFVHVQRPASRPPRSRRASLDVAPLALLLAHLPLGLAMKQSSAVATVHGLLTLAAVLGGALLLPRISPIIYGAVYLASADVFWRMTHARVPWEISKYGLAFVSLIVLARFYKKLPDMRAIWYLALLAPSALITLLIKGTDGFDTISFNLSGPLAIATGVAMFSVVRLEVHEFRRLTYMVAAPIAGIWVIAFQALLRTQTFSTNSSKEAVGGFGPNQVSTMLGFGGLLCILWVLKEKSKLHRFFLGLVGAVFLIQSMLTFSRGGLYNALLALGMVGLLYLKRPSRIVAGAFAVALLIAIFVPVFAEIDGFTGGALGERFRETSVTGRDEIASADLDLWRSEPLTGVGVGRSRELRTSGYRDASAHTEFTRILAEHGTLGLLAIGALGFIAARNLSKREDLWEQAWALALMVWSAAAMTNAAMRVGAISLAFALSSARLIPTAAALSLKTPARRRSRDVMQPTVAGET